MSIAIAIAALAIESAGAESQRDRVVLADADPELLRALVSTLAPWQLEVIVDRAPLVDAADAEGRATAMAARFVVWRRANALVVFDRDRRSMEQRACAKGALDAIGATTAALTVKTLMRLPPPPPPAPPSPPPTIEQPAIPRAAPPRGTELRTQAALAARLAPDVDPGGRLIASAFVRPWPYRGWRFGADVDLGTAVDVARASFVGTWRDWGIHALASWTYQPAWWELEAQLGGGFARGSLVGVEASASRRERATIPVLRGGIVARARTGRWSAGATAAIDGLLDPPTYDRVGSSARVFTAPAYALSLGIVLAADFEALPP